MPSLIELLAQLSALIAHLSDELRADMAQRSSSLPAQLLSQLSASLREIESLRMAEVSAAIHEAESQVTGSGHVFGLAIAPVGGSYPTLTFVHEGQLRGSVIDLDTRYRAMMRSVTASEDRHRDARIDRVGAQLIVAINAHNTFLELADDGEEVSFQEAESYTRDEWLEPVRSKRDPGQGAHVYRRRLLKSFDTTVIDPEMRRQAVNLVVTQGWSWQRAFSTAIRQEQVRQQQHRQARRTRRTQQREAPPPAAPAAPALRPALDSAGDTQEGQQPN